MTPMRIALLLLACGATSLSAQTDAVLRANPTMTPAIRAMLDTIKADNAWTLAQQKSICEIPAPPFHEAARAREMQRRFVSLGYANARIDSIGNVIVERKGTGDWPKLVIAGHLDTVFPEGTNVKVKTAGTRMTAPGIGDDCRGLAVLLAVARAYAKTKLATTGTVYFVANVGEEGPGNLRGTRYLFDHSLKGKIDAFITIDSPGDPGIAYHSVGSIRYKATYRGPGGHSFGAFGTANPIHALGRAIAAIDELTVPTSPKTTFNVGVISGGTSVNSIPFEGSAEIDMRSESADELNRLNEKVLAALSAARDAENRRWNATDPAKQITLKLDTIGIRPANSDQTERTPIVLAALNTAKQLGFTAALETSSTDANYPMSLGVPAIRISGGGSGGNSHALPEWYDDGQQGWLGPQWAALLVAVIAGVKP